MREDWTEVKIGDVAEIQQGTRVDHAPAGELPYAVLGATGTVGSWMRSRYQSPRIALGCRGTVGTVRLVGPNVWFGNNVMALWPKDDRVQLEFLALALTHVDLVGSGAVGGQVQKQITRRSLTPVRIQLPPLDEQRRIVDLIAALDEAIGSAVDLTGATRGVLAQSMRRNPLACKTVPVSSVISYMIGGAWGSPPGDEEVDVIALGARSYANGRTAVDPSTGTARSLTAKRAAARLTEPGDILLERSGGTPTQPVGRVIRALKTSTPVVGSDFQRLIRPNSDLVDPGYLFWRLWSQYEMGETLPFQKATTNIRNLSIDQYLDNSTISLMPATDQRSQAELGDLLSECVVRAVDYAAKLDALRNRLLSALLSGEHEIPASYDELIGV